MVFLVCAGVAVTAVLIGAWVMDRRRRHAGDLAPEPNADSETARGEAYIQHQQNGLYSNGFGGPGGLG
jgi:hypothetical protein